MRNRYLAGLPAALTMLLLPPPVVAGSVSQTVPTEMVRKALSITLGTLTADCSWSPGQTVATMSTSGGNGNPVTWSMTQPGNDFVVNATTGVVSVGAGGINPANCGTVENVTFTANQP